MERTVMSVVEFAVNYWDWYLLIGCVFSFYLLAIFREQGGKVSYYNQSVVFLLAALFWPLIIHMVVR